MIGTALNCYDDLVRSYALTCIPVLMGAAMLAGCGPGGPPSLEGFGSVGATEDTGDGDGDDDPGDGDGDDDPGDGDGDPGECIERNLGSDSSIFLEAFLEPELGSDHEGMCGPNPGSDYSIAWRAPQDGLYRATLYDEFGGWLTVLRGGCEGSLENCGAFGFPTIVDFNAVAGQDYTFVVDTEFEGASGYFTFTLEPSDIPDECPWGELFDVPESVSGSTTGAGSSFSSSCGGEQAPDRAWVFYPPFTGTYRIDTHGSDYDTLLHVFDGYCGGGLVSCVDDSVEGVTSELDVVLLAGSIYTIVVDGWGSSAGDYQLDIELIDGGSLCDDVDVLESIAPTETWWTSTESTGDVFAQCSFASLERRHLWYAPADGIYIASLDNGFSGSVSVSLDGCAGSDFLCGGDTLEFFAFAGQEIVFISEWEPGPLNEMNLQVVPAEVEGCGEELPSEAPLVVEGTTNGSGNQHDGSCSENPVPEVEYWWTAPSSGTYRFTTQGSSYDTMLYIREGGCEGSELGCNDDTFDGQQVFLWSTLTLELVAGQTISLFVDGYSASGSYQLSIDKL